MVQYRQCKNLQNGMRISKIFSKLHMDILENEFKGDYIRNKNIK